MKFFEKQSLAVVEDEFIFGVNDQELMASQIDNSVMLAIKVSKAQWERS